MENKNTQQLNDEIARLRKRIIELEALQGQQSIPATVAPESGKYLEKKTIERTQAEKIIADERNLLRTLIDNLPDYIYIKDKNSRFIANNIAHIHALGQTLPNMVVGKTDFDFLPTKIAQESFTDEREIIKTGQPLINKESIAVFFQNNKKTQLWVSSTKVPVYNDAGEIIGLVCMTRNITKRKILEQQVQRSLERRGRQVKISTDIAQRIAAAPALDDLYHVVVNQIQKQFRYYHVHIYAMSNGKTLIMQEGTGKAGAAMKKFGHQIALNAQKSLVAQAARQAIPVLVSDVTQVPRWLPNPLLPETKSEIAVPIKFGQEVLGVLDIQNNTIGSLTEEDQILLTGLCGQIAIAIYNHRLQLKRREAESKLQIYARELEQSNSELENFAYISSHDLQEPLRKIQAFGDRLQSKYRDVLDERGLDYLSRMMNAAARSQILIQDLLAFSRVSTKAKLFSLVDLAAIVKGVLSDLETVIEKEKAEIEVGELSIINADPTQMRQLFQNLISNAIKFHQLDQNPFIKVSNRTFINKDTGLDMSEICVADNGIGFDEKFVDRIFTIFQRLHGRNEYEGTGIGLAICQKIVERHGGAITAESKPGQGAKFFITLPLKQDNVD